MSEKRGVFDIKKRGEDLSKFAPQISFWVASTLIVLGEIRIVDVVYKITHSWFLSLSALSITGLLFFVWKNNWLYPIADKFQRGVSLVGMIASLLAAVWIGGMDYYIQSGLLPPNWNGGNAIINTLIWGTAGNIIALLLYWYRDPRISSLRAKLEGDEEFKWLEESTDRANLMLDKVVPLMGKYQGMVQQFGKRAADDMILKAGIDPETFSNIIAALEERTGKDINQDGRIGRSNNSSRMPVNDNQTPLPAPKAEKPIEYTLPTFLSASGMNTEQAFGAFLEQTEKLSKAWQVLRDGKSANGYKLPPRITHANFDDLAVKVRANGKVVDPTAG